MIEVEHLTKRYGEVVAVRDISFGVNEGEVVGFLGPNGAGKSTTIRILTAYMPATRGSVRIAGHDVLKDSLEVRRRLGYLPETVPVYPDMRVEEFLRFRATLKGVPRKEAKKRVEYALDRCRVTDMRRRMIYGLSKGYRQRVGLADAIVHDPPLLILDEPTSGLDPNQRREVRNLIRELGEDKTVMLSTHILAEVEAVAERVIIIRKGEVVADGDHEALVAQHGGADQVVIEARASVDELRAALTSVGGVKHVDGEPLQDGFGRLRVVFEEAGDRRAEVLSAAVAGGLVVREVTRPALSLEEIFWRLTTDEGAAAEAAPAEVAS